MSKVELWGTRDGGKSWQKCAEDEDNRSPLQVSVDQEGEYGFSIVVVGTGGDGGSPPQAGRHARAVGERRPPALRWHRFFPSTRSAARRRASSRSAGMPTTTISSRVRSPCTTAAAPPDLGRRSPPIWKTPASSHGRSNATCRGGSTSSSKPATRPATSPRSRPSDPLVVEHEPVVANWPRLPPVE